jgi:hypothetical protein
MQFQTQIFVKKNSDQITSLPSLQYFDYFEMNLIQSKQSIRIINYSLDN